MATKLRVLVVDDEAALREVMRRMLEGADFDVVEGEGHEALFQAAQSDYDLLITDLYMPDVDGFEIVRAARYARPDVPIFCVSGGTEMLPSDFGLKILAQLGVNVLPKPFDRSALLRAVCAAVRFTKSVAQTRPLQ